MNKNYKEMTNEIIQISEKIAEISNIELIGWSKNSDFVNFNLMYYSYTAFSKIEKVLAPLEFGIFNIEENGVCQIRIKIEDLKEYKLKKMLENAFFIYEFSEIFVFIN